MTKATEAHRAGFTALYVGTMNDGLFIIDQPPRPAPKDYDTGTLRKINVIATMTNNDREASKLADLFAASPALYEALLPVKRGAKEADYYCPDDVPDDHVVLIQMTIGELRAARAALAAASPSQTGGR